MYIPALLLLILLPSMLVTGVYASSSPSQPYAITLYRIINGYNDSDGRFNTPYGAVIDRSGRIIVTDNLNNRIQVFDSSGNFLFKFGVPGYDPGGFTHPSGVSVDSNGNIVVADLHNYRVQVFDSNGVYRFQFNKLGPSDGQFTYPISVAVDNRDRIIVVDTYMHSVHVFDSNGNFLFKFGREGSGDGEFSFPTGVAVDGRDRIMVADVWNNRIQVFDSSGNFLFKFGREGSGDGEFMFPTGVAARGDVLAVVDTGNNRVQLFRLIDAIGGSRLQLIDGSDGIIDVGQSIRAVVHSSMGSARFMWIDPDGNIARDVSKGISDGTAEDEFAPSIMGQWRIEVELSDGSRTERLTADAVVVPEFPIALLVLAGLIATMLVLLHSRASVEKTKFTQGVDSRVWHSSSSCQGQRQ
ncbi:MAG: 6-bladed beta-propeller [Candidatus Nitrosocaldus sp.]|nr:6-bladed beta-propeller [Candidatus Nitrosocaldus sp.]